MLTHKEFKARALARSEVKAEYDQLEEEFAFLDEILQALQLMDIRNFMQALSSSKIVHDEHLHAETDRANLLAIIHFDRKDFANLGVGIARNSSFEPKTATHTQQLGS